MFGIHDDFGYGLFHMNLRDDASRRVAATPAASLRHALAVGLGNALEFYDFMTYSFFAIQLGRCFFPAAAGARSLLLSLATFGVGFVTRPLGGFVIGRYGDRRGRRPAMMLSFALMGLGIVGMASIPSYAAIGPAAPALLVFFRLLQGFAVGGEIGPATSYLIEIAPPARRGLYSSFQLGSQGLAVLAAGIVGVLLARNLSAAELDAWGWRVAFLLGALVVPVGLYVRRRLPETLSPPAGPVAAPAPRVPLRLALSAVVLMAAGTISNYVVGYLATYAQDTLRIAASLALGATVAQGATMLVGAVIAGILCDRFGRRPVVVAGIALLLVGAVPGFALVNAWPRPAVVYALSVLSSLGMILASVPMLVLICEALPARSRSGSFGTLYAVAVSLFGGTTQFIVKALIGATGSPLAPAWYQSVALAIGLVALWLGFGGRARES